MTTNDKTPVHPDAFHKRTVLCIRKKTCIRLLFLIMCLLISHVASYADDNLTDKNWQDLGLYGGQITALAVNPVDGNVLYAGSWNGDGLFKSTDAGKSWSTIPGFRNRQILAIVIDPHNPSTIWIADSVQCLVSRDEGATWDVVYDGTTAGRICFSLAVDPHDLSGNTVYLGTSGTQYSYSSGTLFKTDNAGSTWTAVLPFADYPIIAIVCNSIHKGEIWAIASPYFGEKNAGVQYVSTTGGFLWQKYDSGIYTDGSPYYFSSLRNILLHPDDPRIVFMSGSHGVLKKSGGPSKAAGWKWTDMTKPCRALCIHPAEPDTLYAGIAGMVAKSADAGVTWREIPDATASFTQFISLVPDATIPGLLYGGDINRGVFQSGDAAETWNAINCGIRANTILSTDVADDGAILCGSLAGLYLQNAGEAWKLLHTDIAFAVQFHPQDSNILYAGFSWQLGKTTDRGSTWTMLPTSLGSASHGISSFTLSEKKPGTLFSGVRFDSGDRGVILKISDTINDFSRAPIQTVLETKAPVNTLAMHPENPDAVFAGTGNFYAPTSPGDLLTSTDGGATWSPLGLQSLCVNRIVISPVNPSIMYIACGTSDMRYAGILKSTDSGKTWNRRENGLPEMFSAIDIKASAVDPDLAWAAIFRGYAQGEADQSVSLSGIYVTRDGGAYWSQIGLCDYYLFTLNSSETTKSGSSRKTIHAARSASAYSGAAIIAGTSSGLYATSTAGSGFITGRVICSDTNELLDGAIISTSCGNAVSAEGSYMLMLPSGMHTLRAQKPGYTQAMVYSVAVSAGAAAAQDIMMMKAGGDNGTDGGACFLENLLGRHDPRLPAFRRFRDTVLQHSKEGRGVIAAYYSLGKELWPLVQTDSQLAAQAREIVAMALPYAAMAADGKPQTPPKAFLNAATNFMVSLAVSASPEMQKMLRCAVMRYAMPDAIHSILQPQREGEEESKPDIFYRLLR